MIEPFVTRDGHPACGICPARDFPLGEFDVAERPSKECPFDPSDGHRYTAERVPVCVHPEKLGIPAGKYKTGGVSPVPMIDLPADITSVDQYLYDVMHSAAPALLEMLIEQAAHQIVRTFPGLDVPTVLRRALG